MQLDLKLTWAERSYDAALLARPARAKVEPSLRLELGGKLERSVRAVSRHKRAMVPRRALLLASVLRPGLGRFPGRRALSNAPPPPPPRDEEAPWRDGRVVAVCGSTLTMMLGHGVAAPCVPLLSSSLGASAADVGVALSTFGMARLALNVPVGAAADAFGAHGALGANGAVLGASALAFRAAASDRDHRKSEPRKE